MGVLVPDLDNKWADPIVIFVAIIFDYQSGKYKGVISDSAQLPRPPLSGSNGWSADHKLIGGFVESSGGLKTCNVWSVTNFSLSITSKNV